MIELLARNYNWFLIVAVILLFALIGYFIEKKGKKDSKPKKNSLEKEIENFESITDPTITLGDAMNTKEEVIVIDNKEPETVVEEMPEPIVVEKNPDSDIEIDESNKMIIDEPDA